MPVASLSILKETASTASENNFDYTWIMSNKAQACSSILQYITLLFLNNCVRSSSTIV